jgi:ribonuclease III
MKSKDISVFAAALGHTFSSRKLLQQALTHSSYAREQESAQSSALPRIADNEQLEFLGDAVLALVTSEEIFRRFPDFQEGDLSKLRAHLVSERHLVQVARELELGEYLQLGRGEEKSGGRQKAAMLADALEAVLGAVYLDAGLTQCQKVVRKHVIGPELERLALSGNPLPLSDFKSALQEKLQAAGLPQPSYTLLSEHGPEHRKTFMVEARLRSRAGEKQDVVGRAEGSTKKNAEQEAARQVLSKLASLPGGLEAGPQRKRRA